MNINIKLSLFGLGLFLFFPLVVKAQQTDPTLTAAVILQTEELKSAYKKRNETQNKLIEAQAAVAGAMIEVHRVENTILEYMSNASSAMNDLYMLKRSAELVSVRIPEQLTKMAKAVPDNYKGTAITVLTSKTVTQVTSEMTYLYSFMSQLVTSSKYTLGDGKGDTSGKKNINLLSAAERYYIASEVTNRLEKIYRKLYNITYQIETLDWMDAWYNLDSSSWAKFQNGTSISESMMKQWDRLKK